MHTLTFPPQEQEEDQRRPYADAPVSAIAQQASATGLRSPLKAAEARSMTSPPRGPGSPLEDRHQRGESERPRELIDTFAKGDPYRAANMSASPGAPAPQGGGSRERTRLDETTGTSKYGFGATYPTGDSTPSTGDMIRALAEKERAMMGRIRNEIAGAVKARWH